MKYNVKKAIGILLVLGLVICELCVTRPAAAFVYGAEASEQEDGETIPFDISKSGLGYTSFLYDNNSGLPTPEANAIAQTKDGFIWIGSYSGLIRYDGNSFSRFDATVGIASVVSLFVDSQDRLWIGTNDNGLAMYQNGEFTIYGQVDGLNSYSIRSIVESPEGDIIIASTQGIAYVDQNMEFHLINDPQINNEYIFELRLGADGLIYGVGLSGGIFTIKDRRVASYYNEDQMRFGRANTIYPDPDHPGYVYIGTDQSEIIYGNYNDGLKNYKTYSVNPQVTINAIEKIDDKIWICSDNGIGFLDEKYNYYMLENIQMNNSIDRIMVDYEGNLWFTSSRQGVMKIVACVFNDINKAAGLDPMVANTTCIYNGNLYVGTDEGLLILDSGYKKKTNALTKELSGIRIRSIKKDSKNRLWLCTFSEKGLICYDNGKIIIYNTENGIPSNRVRTVTELSDGRIAVACSGGLAILDNGKVTDLYNGDSGIHNTEILTVTEGDNGELYLGSDGDGLYIVKDRMVSRIGIEDGLKSGVILRIKKDPYRNLYWVITNNSLAYMQDQQIHTVTNFPYSNNFDMFFLEDGEVWILASNGIYIVNGDDLKTDDELRYTFYDSRTGLPYTTTANSRNYLDENGNLYIACSAGICSVNIKEHEEISNEIKLAVPYVEVDGRQIYVGSDTRVTIPYNAKRLTIYGYAFTYSLQNPSISYYLEGFDDQQEIVSQMDLEPQTYTNLDGGTYVYHFSIVDPRTGEAQKSIQLTIIKENAFYETVWFKVLVVLLGLLLIGLIVRGYIRYRTEKYKKKQEENRIFINEMIKAFGKCIDMKDKYTNGHSFRVAKYTALFAKHMGYEGERLEEIYNIALLHDIGKISIPDHILGKNGKLDDEEYAIIKSHAANGYEILRDITIMPSLSLGAGYHHERIDGKGYPMGLKGDEIPEIAQIIAVADTFDAMYSNRPYRKQLPIETVIAELNRVKGTQLSERVVEIVNALYESGELLAEADR